MSNRIKTIGKVVLKTSLAALFCISSSVNAKETTDQLKNILSALKATAQTNLQTRTAQSNQLEALRSSINSYNGKIKNSTNQTMNLLSEVREPYSSASALCNLPTDNKTKQACTPKKSDILYKNAYAYDSTFTRYILDYVPELYNQDNRNVGSPRIDNLNQLNYATLFFTDKPQTLFLSQLASPYEFNRQWLWKSSQGNLNSKNPSTRVSKLLPNSIISEVTNPKNLRQQKYRNALKAILLYESAYKSSLATRSVAISILENLAQERVGGANSPLYEQRMIITNMTGTNWTKAMNNASPISLQKAQLLALTQIAKQQYQAHLDRERNTALLSAMLLKINEVSDNSKQFQLKQSLEKMLKQIK